MVKVQFTGQRNGVYQLQVKVAEGKLFRKSLLTSDSTQATAYIEKLKPAIEAAKAHTDAIPKLSASVDRVISGGSNYISLLNAWNLYKKEKGAHWTRPISMANERYFEIILTVLGQDKDVTTITKQDIRDVMEVVCNLPKRVVQPYRSMTVEQLIACEADEDDLIDCEAIHKHMKLYKSVFSTFLTDSKDILTKAPTDGISFPQSKKRYGAYSNSEMKDFVAYAVNEEKRDWLKWIILLLAYTGARRGEIAKLSKDDVRTDKETGRLFILIKDGKTENAVREIVLHDHLLELGFMDYVASMPGLLFPIVAGSNMAKIGKVISDVRDGLNIPKTGIHGQRRLVHSFRHTMITACTGWMKDLTHLQVTVGHELTGTGITARYIHNLPISVISYVIDGLNWR
jgi:integrase